MEILNAVKNWFRIAESEDAKRYAYVEIPKDHVLDEEEVIDISPIEEGKHYFRFWLCDMFLKNIRSWTQKYYSVVHSYIKLTFGNQEVEIPYVVGYSKLQGVSDENTERAVLNNYALTPLLPFNGGVIEIEAGLVKVPGKDYAEKAIGVLSSLSKMLIVPQLSSVISIAQPILNGVKEFTKNVTCEIRLRQSFTSKKQGALQLVPGYIVVIAEDTAKINNDQLWVRRSQLYYGSKDENNLFNKASYMLLRIESRTERDDFRSLTTIMDVFNEALKTLNDGRSNPEEEAKAEDSLKKALAIAWASPDLTRADRSRVIQVFKEEFEKVRGQGLGAIPPTDDPEKTFRNAISLLPIPQKEITFEELVMDSKINN